MEGLFSLEEVGGLISGDKKGHTSFYHRRETDCCLDGGLPDLGLSSSGIRGLFGVKKAVSRNGREAWWGGTRREREMPVGGVRGFENPEGTLLLIVPLGLEKYIWMAGSSVSGELLVRSCRGRTGRGRTDQSDTME